MACRGRDGTHCIPVDLRTHAVGPMASGSASAVESVK